MIEEAEGEINSHFGWQKNQIYEQELQREQQNEKNEYPKLKLKDIFPLNFASEKESFFKHSTDYCPHFVYKTAVYPEPLKLHTEHQKLAYKILKNAPPYPTNIPYLGQQQVISTIEQYLDEMGLKDFVEIKLEFECLSRTSVTMFKKKAIIKIRTPLSYTKVNLEGVLHHEISTHILRTLNHRQNCLRKPSEKGKIIQEGLAVINQLLPEEKPVLFKPALRYIAAIEASKCNFRQLYKKLSKYVPDKDQCWRECVRVKRGIGNTEEHGGYYKDQNYLIGAIEILQNRKDIDFEKIYYGKLSPQETKSMSVGVLPPFLGTPEKLKSYMKKLQKIALTNFID